jgi:hypothetical protein
LYYVIYFDFKIKEYKPTSGSSCIKTPKWISDKKATLNIKNEDEIKCNPERLYIMFINKFLK